MYVFLQTKRKYVYLNSLQLFSEFIHVCGILVSFSIGPAYKIKLNLSNSFVLPLTEKTCEKLKVHLFSSPFDRG
jgi:hypothetical protein